VTIFLLSATLTTVLVGGLLLFPGKRPESLWRLNLISCLFSADWCAPAIQ